ncbi:MAG: transposase [Pleurocapsa sp. CRU_1_2]|nr:transposase [Pleurocapsa sp. CRU_1_2]
MDDELFPSLLLAAQYHWRWEIENTLSVFKTHLNARKTPIRSKKSKLVVQEIYGWLLAHWAVRSLIFRVSTTTDKSPVRFSLTETLRILRRATMPMFRESIKLHDFVTQISLEDVPLS